MSDNVYGLQQRCRYDSLLVACYDGPGRPSDQECSDIDAALEHVVLGDSSWLRLPPHWRLDHRSPLDTEGLAAANAIGNFLGWCYPEPWPCPLCGGVIEGWGPWSGCTDCQLEASDCCDPSWNRRPSLVPT